MEHSYVASSPTGVVLHLSSALQLPLRTRIVKRVDTMPVGFSPTTSITASSTITVGMPLITPVMGSRFSPAGSGPSSVRLKEVIRFTKRGVSGSISVSFTSVIASTPYVRFSGSLWTHLSECTSESAPSTHSRYR